MPNLYLHAGAPKTGTSYLQVLFAKYAERLEDAGIRYPRGHLFDEAKAGQITSGNGVEMANYIRPNLPHNIPDKTAFITNFETELTNAGGRHILYSSEFLLFPQGEKTDRIISVARAHGYTPKYIYLVRDIDQAAFSTYSQQVKRAGEARIFAEYLRTWEPLYRHSIQLAAEAFGETNVLAYNYEEWREKLSRLFFAEILDAGFAPEDNVVVNRSLSPKEAELQRLMNEVSPNRPGYATFISDALMSISKAREPFVLTFDEAAFLEKRFKDAVAYVNGFVRGRPTVVSSSETVAERPAVATSDFERAIVAIVGKLVARTVK